VAAGAAVLERGAEVVEHLALPLVEQAGLDSVFLAKRRHRDFVGEVPSENGGLLLSGEWAASTARGSTHGLLLLQSWRG